DRLRMLAERFRGLYSLSDDPALVSPCRHHVFLLQPVPSDIGQRENPAISAARLAAVVFTSGSTGEPVAHYKSWGALTERSNDAAACFGMTASCPASI